LRLAGDTRSADTICKPIASWPWFAGRRCLRVGSTTPVLQEPFGGDYGVVAPELPESFLQVVRGCQWLVQHQCFVQSLRFVDVLVLLEVVGVLQQQPADSLEDFAMHAPIECSVQVATQHCQFLVHELDDMEMVEHQLGFRKVFQPGGDVIAGHVRGDRLDLRFRILQPVKEALQARDRGPPRRWPAYPDPRPA
jgi:hypothetical protein